MKKNLRMATVVLGVVMVSSAAFAAADKGETIFKAKCAACHPNGGNVINASKSIKGIKKASIITDKVRKGGGKMPAFDAKAISDADNKLLANYIIKTFSK